MIDNDPDFGAFDSSYTEIDAKLRSVAETLPETPAWFDALQDLNAGAAEEERLAVYRAIRNTGTLPEEAGFFLVSWLIDDIATRDADEALGDIERRLKAIEREYGFDESAIWVPGTAPAGYEKLREQYHRDWDELFARRLEEFGEEEMARLLRNDPEQFEERTEAGRRYFAGPQSAEELVPELWVRRLVEAAAKAIKPDGVIGPVGYRYQEQAGGWTIEIFPTPVELVGGADDGTRIFPAFALDLEVLMQVLDHVDGLLWYSPGLVRPSGDTCITIEGIDQDHEVLVLVRATAPEDEEPGMRVDASRQ